MGFKHDGRWKKVEKMWDLSDVATAVLWLSVMLGAAMLRREIEECLKLMGKNEGAHDVELRSYDEGGNGNDARIMTVEWINEWAMSGRMLAEISGCWN